MVELWLIFALFHIDRVFNEDILIVVLKQPPLALFSFLWFFYLKMPTLLHIVVLYRCMPLVFYTLTTVCTHIPMYSLVDFLSLPANYKLLKERTMLFQSPVNTQSLTGPGRVAAQKFLSLNEWLDKWICDIIEGSPTCLEGKRGWILLEMIQGTSLMNQGLRLCATDAGAWVWSLVRELDPACLS